MKSPWSRNIGKGAVCLISIGCLYAGNVGPVFSESQQAPAKKQGVATPKYGGVTMPKYGNVETRKFGEVPVRFFGEVPVAPEGSNPPVQPGDVPLQKNDTYRPIPLDGQLPKTEAAPPVRKADFTGRYYGYEGQTLHAWDFLADGTFLHTRIAAGSGTNVRNLERGDFRLDGNYVELQIRKATTGATTPGLGGRSTLALGGSEAKEEVRRLKIQFLKEGIIIGGRQMKVKSW